MFGMTSAIGIVMRISVNVRVDNGCPTNGMYVRKKVHIHVVAYKESYEYECKYFLYFNTVTHTSCLLRQVYRFFLIQQRIFAKKGCCLANYSFLTNFDSLLNHKETLLLYLKQKLHLIVELIIIKVIFSTLGYSFFERNFCD